jgi:hypothetical protein
MKRFKSIAEWLKTNPSQAEQDKVLILIHRGETSRVRKELWEKEQFLRKLQSFANHCKKLGFSVPEGEKEALIKTKKEIEELRKELPPVQKRVKKETELAAQE